ncbi:MAG: glycosyltransferase [Lachnospiraceae bacterium]|nr:glycosyltransferase [Lachnospiraceae bacterium]
MPKISIIMPSLNVVSYIRECMESVICQTLEEIEVLCVDAGSTDGTWEVLEEYARKDRRIRLIKSSKKSYGYQMNRGIEEASGEYIGIVETDDFILPEMYERLYLCAKENDAEVVKSDFDVFTTLEDGERIFLRYSLKKYSCITYNTLYKAEDYRNHKQTIDVFIWNGIYKKNFLKENQILFQETPGAAFQDCGFRYQVALNLKRGFFLEDSFYRYRRDNINSSTYNNKCVLFNLMECQNLLKVAKRTGKTSKEQMSFLAKEIAIIAHRPYVELLTWSQPAKESKEALDGFRILLKSFMDQGLLGRASVTREEWLEIRMFIENPECYAYYAQLKAEIAAQEIKGFLKNIAGKRQVILFGSGYVGSCVYCLIRNNGIENIVAFCDNNRSKWKSSYMGYEVISPEDAVMFYPDAYFLITVMGHSKEIERQLQTFGVDRKRIGVYGFTTFPMDCTNIVMRACDNRS